MHIFDDFIATANLQRKSSSLGYWYLDYLLLQKKISKELIQDIATKYNTYEKFSNCEYYSYYFSSLWFKTRYDFIVQNFLNAVCSYRG